MMKIQILKRMGAPTLKVTNGRSLARLMAAKTRAGSARAVATAGGAVRMAMVEGGEEQDVCGNHRGKPEEL
jgi:hypothetical protein